MTSFFAWSRTLVLLSLTQFFLCRSVFGDRVESLFTSSVTYCAPPEAILIDEFSIVYFAANQTVSFNISAASVVPNLRVTANIFLNVYGMQPINITEDFCSILGNAICPLPTYNFTGSATIPLPSSIDVASRVPNIAYTIPDLEAFAQLTLTDINTGDVAACIQATLSNGWSTRQPAVAYTTGGFAIFALISSLLHSLLPSTPFAPSPTYSFLSIAPTRFVDYVLLFQQIAMTGFLHLNFPLVYRAFVTNFAWSLGLFPGSQPIQRAIDHLRHLTGSKLGDGVQNPIAFANRALSPYNEIPNNLAASAFALAANLRNNLVGRDGTDSSAGQGPPATVTNNDQDILSAGIPVYVNSLNIGTANAFMSVFFTVLIGAVVGAGILGIMYLILTFLTTRLKGNRWAWTDVLHAEFRWFAVSNGIRCALIILYPVLVFTFFEWTLHDSWLVIFLSVILLIALSVALLYPTVRTVLIARRSSSEVLYTLPSLVRTYGAFYIPYKPPRYYVFIILLAAAVLKCIFIGFAQSSGLTQVTAVFIIELAVLVLICLPRPPFRSRRGDILGIYLAATRLAGAILMFPFVEKFGIKPIPRVAVGFVLIVLFSIAVLVLTFNVVFNFGKGLLWMRHGDEHLRSSMGSTSSSSDIEKQSNSNSNQPNEDHDGSKQRPSNPTPTTTFSQEHDRSPPPPLHSRHTPNMSAAVSPGFTIPSAYSSEDGDIDSIAFRSALPSPSSYPSTRRSSGQSGFSSGSTPSTAKSSRFSHRRYESGSDNHHQHRLSTHEEDADIPT